MTTAFSPTPTRDLHVGHAYLAFLNWQEARLSGGEFVALWDDETYRNGACEQSGFSFAHGMERTRAQLTWLGLAPDREHQWSEFMAAGRKAAEKLGYRLPRPCGTEPTHHGLVWGMPASPYPYVALYEPGLTCCWVVGEAMAGIDGYYTGADFVTTCLLYEDICKRLGYRSPRRMYVPCVRRETMPEKESKSQGAVSIEDLRLAGYEPWQVISTLRECDRLSRLAGLADTVIPSGVLDIPEVRWLEYQGDVERLRANVEAYKNLECVADVRAYLAEWECTNLEAQRGLMTG